MSVFDRSNSNNGQISAARKRHTLIFHYGQCSSACAEALLLIVNDLRFEGTNNR